MTYTTLQSLVRSLGQHGSRPALVAMGAGRDPQSLTYQALGERVARLAAGLAAEGLSAGAPCLLYAPNSSAWIISCLALLETGAVPVPVDSQARYADLAHIRADCDAQWIFTTCQVARQLAQRADPLPRLVLLDERAEVGVYWEDLVQPVAHEPDAAPVAAERAILFYTSGTSGPPKGVPLSHANMLSNLDALLARSLVRDDDRLLLPLPLHHVYPFVVGLLLALASGLAVVLPRSLTGAQLRRALHDGEATILLGVPRLYEAFVTAIDQRLIARGRLTVAGFRTLLWITNMLRRVGLPQPGRWLFSRVRREFAPRLRLMVSGGSALPPEVADLLQGLGWQIASGYGLTETSPILTWNMPGRGRPSTAGRPLAGTEMRIAEPEGGSEYGEVQARGPNVFAGYHNLPDRSAAAFTSDGWFRTGDLGRFDAQGYLHLHGRTSAMVVLPGGENIDPERLEQVLAQSPAVREAGVLARNGRLVAVVVPAAELARANDSELGQRLRTQINVVERTLPSYQRLHDLVIDRRPLARTRLGKLRRQELAERYAHLISGAAVRETGPEPADLAPEDRQLLEDPIAAALWAWLEGRFPDRGLNLDSHLRLDLQVDSMDWLNLTLEIRDRVGVELQAEAVGRIETLRDLLMAAVAAESIEPGGGDLLAMLRKPDRELSESQLDWLAPPSPALRVLSFILVGLARVLMRRFFHLQVTGMERLPRDGACLLVPNHLSALDPIALLVALGATRLRKTYWGGWVGIMFDHPLMRLVSRANRVLPVEQSRGSLWSLQLGAAALSRGFNLVWFPEGGRSETGKLQPFRPGVGLLIQAQPVPVVPVWIQGTRQALPPGKLWPQRRPIAVTVGQPMDPAELSGGRDADDIAAALQARVAALGDVAQGPVVSVSEPGNWEHFEHEADVGLRATAATREAVFALMGEALTAVVTDPASVRAEQEQVIHCEAPDDALLLVDWLNALIYAMATQQMLFGRWQVQLEGFKLKATVAGEPIDRQRHRPVVEVKGATYTALQMTRRPSGMWRAQCVVDV